MRTHDHQALEIVFHFNCLLEVESAQRDNDFDRSKEIGGAYW